MRRWSAVLVAVALLAGCGGSGSSVPHSKTVSERLRARLVARYLPPRWVACVPTRFRLRGRTAFRCNVNFGDPHVEAYCAVLHGDGLLYAAWRQPNQGRQDRLAAQRECVQGLR
jgi:hypothetical protein